MKPEEVPAFARVLGIEPNLVIEYAGLTYLLQVSLQGRHSKNMLAEDAARWTPPDDDEGSRPTLDMARLLGGGRPGMDIWQVRGNALALEGYREGDFLLVDHNAADRAKSGDIVIAQIYDWQQAAAVTVLRRYEPPVLVAAGFEPEDRKVYVVDGNNVAIKGIIIASWRGGVRH